MAYVPSILMVDGCTDQSDMYAEHLNRAGFRVITARDSTTALRLIADLKPAIVTTEMSVEPGGGIALIQAIRQHDPTIKVMALTAAAMPAQVARAYEAGFDDVCTKPCLPEHLERRLRALLREGEVA